LNPIVRDILTEMMRKHPRKRAILEQIKRKLLMSKVGIGEGKGIGGTSKSLVEERKWE
jgi:hypothetical protein